MDRGNIPGYYYDAVKKKYFKIQADHVAPVDAKYNKTNVKQEKRETKKRRLEEKQEYRVIKETVPTAKSLKHPLIGGTGLLREQGNIASHFCRSQRDEALIGVLQREEIRLHFSDVQRSWQTRISDVLFLREKGTCFIARAIAPGSNCLYSQEWSSDFEWNRPVHAVDEEPVWACADEVVGLCRSKDVMGMLAGHHDRPGGTVFVKSLDEDLTTAMGGNETSGFHVGGADSTLWDCKLQWDTNKAAVGWSGGVHIHAPGPTGFMSLTNFPALGAIECFAVDWLDANIIAAGTRKGEKRYRNNETLSRNRIKGLPPSEFHHEVFLCDLRSGGVASRLKRRDRITGIHVPNQSGTNILVSSSYQLGLYDLRNLKMDQPLLSIEHLSGTTRLSTPTYADLVAVTDQYNKIQTYSLRTGRYLRTFTAPREKGLLSRPRWEEDYRGSPYLQACASNTIQRWSWRDVNEV